MGADGEEGRPARRISASGRVGPPSDRWLIAAARMAPGTRSRWTPTGVGPVHALEIRGRGRGTAVMIHGFSSSGAHLLGLIGRLRGCFARILAPDLPGHGLTPLAPGVDEAPSVELRRAGVEALAAALDALCDGPMTLFGSSMGGLAAARYAAGAPDRVDRLVLSSPAGAAMDSAALGAFLAGFDLRDHAAALGFVDRVMEARGVARHMLAWGVRRRFARPALRALVAAARPDELLSPAELGALTMPTLCLWGERDRVMPPAARRFFRERLPPHARFEVLAGLGHGPYLERPDVVARRIAAFVEDTGG